MGAEDIQREAAEAEEEDGMMALPKDRHRKRIWKRCRRCRQSQKVARATKYCPRCKEDGKVGLMESIIRGQ